MFSIATHSYKRSLDNQLDSHTHISKRKCLEKENRLNSSELKIISNFFDEQLKQLFKPIYENHLNLFFKDLAVSDACLIYSLKQVTHPHHKLYQTIIDQAFDQLSLLERRRFDETIDYIYSSCCEQNFN